MSMAACSLQIAVDSIENIHTVAALRVEDNFFHQYKKMWKLLTSKLIDLQRRH